MVWKNARMRRDQIVVPDKQVRSKNFDQESLSDMAKSIREVGQLQPVVVQPFGDKYRLVFGERRLRAMAMAGLDEVDVRIVDANLAPAEIIQMQLIENVARENLNPLELAYGIKDLMQEAGCTATEVASKLGMSNATISRLLPLADLPPLIQAQIKDGAIPGSAGYDLSRVKDVGEQLALAQKIASGKLTRDGLSGIVRRKGSGRKHTGTGKTARIRAELRGRSVTLAGEGLESIDAMIETLEILLSRARKARPQGLELGTFLRILRDEARA
jgi:ParB family chromosome partitioning protein